MRKFVFFSFLIVSFSMATPSFAQDDPPTSAEIKRAAIAYDQGRERFREGQYTEAAEKFEAADDYAPSAAALRLAIFARKEAGQLARALTHAALALELYPDNAELQTEAQAVIDEAGSDFGKVRVACDEPCELLLNNRIVHGRAATERLLYVEPGSANVRASWSEERIQSEHVTVSAGGEESLSFYSPEIPTKAPTAGSSEPVDSSTNAEQDDEGRKGWHPAIFVTSLSLTLVGAGATVGLGINAQNNPGKEAVLAECAQNDKTCETYKKGVRNQTYVNVAVGATAALGIFTIVSAIMTDWGGKKKNEDAMAYKRGNLSIRPTFALGDSAVLGATGTF